MGSPGTDEATRLRSREELEQWDNDAQDGAYTIWKYRFRQAMARVRLLEQQK